MRLLRRGVDAWILDGSFQAAFIAAFVLALLVLGAQRNVQRAAAGLPEAFVLTRTQQIPSGDGTLTMRVGFPTADARVIAERLAPVAKVGLLGFEQHVAESGGRRIALDLLVLSPHALALLAPNARCDSSTLWIEGGSNEAGLVSPLQLDGLSYSLVRADLRRARGLTGATGQLAVQCRPDGPASISTILAHGPELGLATLRVLAQDESLFRNELFGTQLGFEPLGAALHSAAETRYAWARGGAWPALALLALLFLAWGVLQGIAQRKSLLQRRILGASLPSLARRISARALLRALPALGIACGLVLLLTERQRLSWPDFLNAGSLAVLAVIACVAAIAPQFALSLRGIDRRLRTAIGGTQITASLRPYLALWTVGIAVTLLSALLGASIASHASRILDIDLGYEPAGLVALPLRAAADADLPRLQQAVLQWASQHGAGVTSLVCFAPWEFKGHSAVLGTDASIGTGMGGGPAILETLQVRRFSGRDFDRTDMKGASMMMQGDDVAVGVLSRSSALVARVEGLHVGALYPERRLLSIQPIEKLGCRDFSLLVRGMELSAEGLIDLRDRLARRFPELAVSEAREVAAVIASARRPLTELAGFLIAAAVLAAAQQLLVSFAVARAFLMANERDMAVRQALGERPSAASMRLATRSAGPALLALGAAVAAAYLLQGLLAGLVVGFAPLPPVVTWSISVSVTLAALLALWSAAHLRIRGLNLPQALAAST